MLFADISGFVGLTTRLTQKDVRGSERLIRILDDSLQDIAQSVANRGGEVISIMGDSFVAFWPEAEDAVATVRCAAQCSFDLHAASRGAEENTQIPEYRAAVSFGTIEISGVGGYGGRMLIAPTGEALREACLRFHDASPGQTVICESAGTLIGDEVEAGQSKTWQQISEQAEAGGAKSFPASATTVDCIPNGQLQHYLPRFLFEHLSASPQKWLAQFRRVTTVFVCHRGELQTLERLQSFILAAQREIGRCGGSVEQVTVDEKGVSSVGAFGLPGYSNKDDATRAIRAALALDSKLEELGFEIGIGVSSGLLYCGDVGSQSRRNFALYGPSINLAARLTALGLRVVCDEATADAAGYSFELSSRELPRMAGIKGRQRLFFPKRERSEPIAKTQRLIGRDNEMALTQRRLDELADGKGGLLLIGGEPGIGKTRVMQETLSNARQRHMRVVSEAVSSSAKSAPLDIWMRILQGLDRTRDVADYAEIGNDESSTDDRSSLFPPEDLSAPATWAIRFKIEVVNRIGSAESGPLVIGIDDLHRIDDASLELLREVLDEVANCLVLATVSPLTPEEVNVVEQLRRSAGVDYVRLGPLSRREVGEQARTVLGVEAISPDLATLLFAKTGGHPLFCEELVLALRAGARLSVEDGVFGLSDEESVDIAVDTAPDLNGAIAMRLDSLPLDQRMVLRSASVLGQEFNRDTLRVVIPDEVATSSIDREIGALMDSGFLMLGESDALQFKHGLTRDIVYGQLPNLQRRELHMSAYRDLADKLGHNSSNATDLASVAIHAEGAGQIEAAIGYIEDLIRLSRIRNANRTAIQQQRRAFKLAEQNEIAISTMTKASWWMNLADAHHELSEHHEAVHAYTRALAILGDVPPRGPLKLAWRTTAEIGGHAAQRLLPKRRAPIQTADFYIGDLSAHAYQRLSEVAFFQNDSLGVLHHTLRAANLAEKSDILDRASISHASLAIGLGLNGLGSLARYYRDMALAASDATADPSTRAYVRLLAMVLALGEGDWATIERVGDEAVQLYLETDDEFRQLQARTMQFYGQLQTGNPDRAQSLLDEIHSLESSKEFHQIHYWSVTSTLLMDLFLHEPRRNQIDKVRSLMNDRMDLSDRMMGHGLTAIAWFRLGFRDMALVEADAAIDLLIQRPPTIGGGYLYGAAGPAEVMLSHAGDPSVPSSEKAATRAKAGTAIRALRTYARRVPVSRPRICLLQGAAAAINGNAKRARAHWARGAAIADGMGMGLDWALLDRSIAAGSPQFGHLEHLH